MQLVRVQRRGDAWSWNAFRGEGPAVQQRRGHTRTPAIAVTWRTARASTARIGRAVRATSRAPFRELPDLKRTASRMTSIRRVSGSRARDLGHHRRVRVVLIAGLLAAGCGRLGFDSEGDTPPDDA